MSVKRTLKVYEILQIAMNPARAFVTHICKTLKNGTGFQATCKNLKVMKLKPTIIKNINLADLC